MDLQQQSVVYFQIPVLNSELINSKQDDVFHAFQKPLSYNWYRGLQNKIMLPEASTVQQCLWCSGSAETVIQTALGFFNI